MRQGTEKASMNSKQFENFSKFFQLFEFCAKALKMRKGLFEKLHNILKNFKNFELCAKAPKTRQLILDSSEKFSKIHRSSNSASRHRERVRKFLKIEN